MRQQDGGGVEARRHAPSVSPSSGQSGWAGESRFLAALSLAALDDGQLSQAAALASESVDRIPIGKSAGIGTPHYVWGMVLLERNELGPALASLKVARRRAALDSSGDGLVLSQVAIARAWHAHGSAVQAEAALDAASRVAGSQDGPMWAVVQQGRAELALADADLAGAASAISQVGEPARSRLGAWLHAVSGDHEMALALLPSLPAPTKRERLVDLLVEARCRRGDDRLLLIRDAVLLAEPDRYVLPFVQQGHWIVPPLQLLDRAWPTAYAHHLRRAVEAPHSRLGEKGAPSLSRREEEVLVHLGSRLSIAEIGGLLGISTNTVKSHARSIYQKLGLRNRAEADAWRREAEARQAWCGSPRHGPG